MYEHPETGLWEPLQLRGELRLDNHHSTSFRCGMPALALDSAHGGDNKITSKCQQHT
jgi:hypothetical protein